MKLFRIKTRLIARKLDKKLILEYVVAESEEDVFDIACRAIIPAEGDFESRCFESDNYNQYYQWDDLGEVTPEEIATLRRLGVLATA